MNTENRLTQDGKFVRRYNISKAIVEDYFIPANNKKSFDFARTKQDLNANNKFGTRTEHFSLL